MSNNLPKVAKIQIDRKACIGAATCVVIAPDAFELDAQGISVAKVDATNNSTELLLQAAKSCPVSAIKLFDEQGKVIE